MQLIIVITMVTMMGGSVISPALPIIQQALEIETSKIGLLMTGKQKKPTTNNQSTEADAS